MPAIELGNLAYPDGEHLFRQIVEQAHEGIWVIDPAGRTTFVNPRMCELLGYSAQEMLGRVHTEFMFEEDRPNGDVQMEHRRIGTREIWDQRYCRKDGRELWTLATCCPIHEQGVFVGALGMFADITQRKSLESALLESESRFRGTFENAAVGMAHVALDGRWLRVNRRLSEMLGYSVEELMQVTFRDVTYPEDLAEDLELAEKVKTGVLPGYTLEKRYCRKDGSVFWGELSVSLLHDERGQPLHFISVVKDVTIRKQALTALNQSREDLLAASGAKDRFLATLSHELRAPLTPVLLEAGEAARDPELPDRFREVFRSIADAVTHQAAMIDDLLDLTRIVSGKLHVRTERLDLGRLLASLVGSLRPSAEARQLAFQATLPEAQTAVSGDATRLRQVFHNLLSNAFKFTPAGGRVEVNLERSGDGTQAVVSIRDTGMGMNPGEIGRLFERFAQGDHARDNPTRFGGLGLGLTIARGLVEQHGGTLTANSAGPSSGSTFVVRLPLAR